MAGSLCFVAGSLPGYSQRVDPGAVGMTFFAGSVLFTAAAYSQFLEAIRVADDSQVRPTVSRFWAWRPRSMLWWAAIVQLVGTLFFNVNTFDAMLDGLSTRQTNYLVWAPDFFGSIAFLVASHLAWLLACGRLWCVRTGDEDWWMACLNYVGSIFFMLSAIGAFTLPTTGNVAYLTLVNTGTFLGAICFLVGAYLMLPPAAARGRPAVAE